MEKYVPNSIGIQFEDFRLYHDAAAAAEASKNFRRTDAAPVTSKDVAVNVAENYANSNYDKQHVEALQEIVWVRECFDLRSRSKSQRSLGNPSGQNEKAATITSKPHRFDTILSQAVRKPAWFWSRRQEFDS